LKQSSDSDLQSHFYTAPYSLHSSFHELADFVRRIRPKQIVPTSDSEAGGLESCSALCHHALRSENEVRVTALQSIVGSSETAHFVLGKRSSSGLYQQSRKTAICFGATPDSPSPCRSPQVPLQNSLPANISLQTLSCTSSCSSSDIEAVDIDVDESCPCGQDGVLLQEHSGSTFISQNGCESDESSELDDDAADCNCGPFGGRAAYF
jgi:hypothetical protein